MAARAHSSSKLPPEAPLTSIPAIVFPKGRGEQKRRKSAVVPTKSILKAANVPIIGSHHVPALQGSPERWQATSLLERCREYAGRPGARGTAARAVPG